MISPMDYMKYISLLRLSILVTIMILCPGRTNCFSISRRSTFFRGGWCNSFPRVALTSRASNSKSIFDGIEVTKQNEQDRYIEEMKDWRGTSRSTSDFVTHFIASCNNITIEEAIHSVLPKGFDSIGRENNLKRREDLLDEDSNDFLSKLEMKFRHEPIQFPLHEQLAPVELMALGSIWYLPANAPRDPGM